MRKSPPPPHHPIQSSLKSPGCSRKSSEVSFDRVVSSVVTDPGSRKRTLSCSTTATAHSTASSYTSYNLDESDADHMAYLESRYTD